MKDQASVAEQIRIEIKSDLSGVRDAFLSHFDKEVEEFIGFVTRAFLRWHELDVQTTGHEKKTYVSGLVYSAITQHVMALRLFLSGYIVPAGNLQRQVFETIALALLCSSDKLSVLDLFIKDRYSEQNSIRDALSNSDNLNVHKDALKSLKKGRDIYNKYSHPSLATLVSHVRFSDEGRALFVGASFDEGKLKQYQKEMEGRLNLARVLENFVVGIVRNLSIWA